MTTIKDLLLASLRDIGADGVWYPYPSVPDGETVPIDHIERDVIWSGPHNRPAFRDADGRLVPLPDEWGARGNCLVHRRTGFLIYRGGKGFMFSRYAGGVESYPTAPEAWAAAEAWLKSVAERAPVAQEGE